MAIDIQQYVDLAEDCRTKAERAQERMRAFVAALRPSRGPVAELEASKDERYKDLAAERNKNIALSTMYSNLAIMHRLCDPTDAG